MDNKPAMLNNSFCQMAYVTNDIDAAMTLFADQHDIRNFLQLRDCDINVGPDKFAKLHIALAMAGGIQIEIMQPLSGEDHIYRQILHNKGGFEMHYHHEAQRVESFAVLQQLKDTAAGRGFPVVLDGHGPEGVAYFYADCGKTLGHHVEYIWYSDEAFAQVCGAIPIN